MRNRNSVIETEKKEIERAFDVIKEITEGQFTHADKGITYHGDDEHYKQMLQQFESIKPVLFYTRNNKWLIMAYVAKHEGYAQLVSTLLGFQGQNAYDSNDEALQDKLHIETCIWRSIRK